MHSRMPSPFLKLVKSKGKKLFNDTQVYTLYNEEATKENILATLDQIVQNANPQDVFFFYYAGHGSMTDGNFYFIPTDNVRLYDLELLKNDAINAAEIQAKFCGNQCTQTGSGAGCVSVRWLDRITGHSRSR